MHTNLLDDAVIIIDEFGVDPANPRESQHDTLVPYFFLRSIRIFDNIQILANKKLSKRVDFEFIIAEINRDKKDLNRRYRNSDMTEAPVTISMRNIAYGPNSVSAKIIGSYFNDGSVSSLLVEDDNKPANKIEALLKT